jgi:2-polyprenyl-6-methoxyphenol hydroxylase-like FAD-dependent oxidoreductase
MAPRRAKALIIGAGIGGLAAALACHQRGMQCEIYEQSDTVNELGVGINILPNAVRELSGLSLLGQLDQAGVRTRRASTPMTGTCVPAALLAASGPVFR